MLKDIQLTRVATAALFTDAARESTYIRKTDTAKVPMAAIIWLMVRLDINTPTDIIAPP